MNRVKIKHRDIAYKKNMCFGLTYNGSKLVKTMMLNVFQALTAGQWRIRRQLYRALSS